MTVLTAILIITGVILYTLAVRSKDLPKPEPVSPVAHLEERRATIYDNLRDLQFEYRVGKLSDQDYQQTKVDLQRELASVLAEIDRVLGTGVQPSPEAPPTPTAKAPEPGTVCPKCGARFPQPLKFCGECGSPMKGEST